jgi:hypothetical protein
MQTNTLQSWLELLHWLRLRPLLLSKGLGFPAKPLLVVLDDTVFFGSGSHCAVPAETFAAD